MGDPSADVERWQCPRPGCLFVAKIGQVRSPDVETVRLEHAFRSPVCAPQIEIEARKEVARA